MDYDEANELVDETSIEDVGFGVRTYNSLCRSGINCLEDLAGKSAVDLLKIRNLGKKVSSK